MAAVSSSLSSAAAHSTSRSCRLLPARASSASLMALCRHERTAAPRTASSICRPCKSPCKSGIALDSVSVGPITLPPESKRAPVMTLDRALSLVLSKDSASRNKECAASRWLAAARSTPNAWKSLASSRPIGALALKPEDGTPMLPASVPVPPGPRTVVAVALGRASRCLWSYGMLLSASTLADARIARRPTSLNLTGLPYVAIEHGNGLGYTISHFQTSQRSMH